MPEIGYFGAGCSFLCDSYTAFAVERIDHFAKVTYLPYTYLRKVLCGTGADKPTVESELCTHIC